MFFFSVIGAIQMRYDDDDDEEHRRVKILLQQSQRFPTELSGANTDHRQARDSTNYISNYSKWI